MDKKQAQIDFIRGALFELPGGCAFCVEGTGVEINIGCSYRGFTIDNTTSLDLIIDYVGGPLTLGRHLGLDMAAELKKSADG